nr:hypothetical protein [Tanacetum cinerariifolium]
SLPELTPTRMTLKLADRSITHPKGVAEDVFAKVGKFHFPTDFEADPKVTLILGRSFLRNGRALIDVYGEEITLRYNPKSSNPTLVSDDLISEIDSCKVPIVKSSSPTPTPFRESNFSLDEIKDFLNDDSIPTGIENPVVSLKKSNKNVNSLRMKERPPMLAPGNYVQWKSIIKRYIGTKPNHELIHYCLENPLYELGWKDKEVSTSEGSLVTRTERVNETYKNVSQDIRD